MVSKLTYINLCLVVIFYMFTNFGLVHAGEAIKVGLTGRPQVEPFAIMRNRDADKPFSKGFANLFKAQLINDHDFRDNHKGWIIEWDVLIDGDIWIEKGVLTTKGPSAFRDHTIRFNVDRRVLGKHELVVNAYITEMTEADHGDYNNQDGRNYLGVVSDKSEYWVVVLGDAYYKNIKTIDKNKSDKWFILENQEGQSVTYNYINYQSKVDYKAEFEIGDGVKSPVQPIDRPTWRYDGAIKRGLEVEFSWAGAFNDTSSNQPSKNLSDSKVVEVIADRTREYDMITIDYDVDTILLQRMSEDKTIGINHHHLEFDDINIESVMTDIPIDASDPLYTFSPPVFPRRKFEGGVFGDGLGLWHDDNIVSYYGVERQFRIGLYAITPIDEGQKYNEWNIERPVIDSGAGLASDILEITNLITAVTGNINSAREFWDNVSTLHNFESLTLTDEQKKLLSNADSQTYEDLIELLLNTKKDLERIKELYEKIKSTQSLYLALGNSKNGKVEFIPGYGKTGVWVIAPEDSSVFMERVINLSAENLLKEKYINLKYASTDTNIGTENGTESLQSRKYMPTVVKQTRYIYPFESIVVTRGGKVVSKPVFIQDGDTFTHYRSPSIAAFEYRMDIVSQGLLGYRPGDKIIINRYVFSDKEFGRLASYVEEKWVDTEFGVLGIQGNAEYARIQEIYQVYKEWKDLGLNAHNQIVSLTTLISQVIGWIPVIGDVASAVMKLGGEAVLTEVIKSEIKDMAEKEYMKNADILGEWYGLVNLMPEDGQGKEEWTHLENDKVGQHLTAVVAIIKEDLETGWNW